jgi:hypothetical protein
MYKRLLIMLALLFSLERVDGVFVTDMRRLNAAKVDKNTDVFMAFNFYALVRFLVFGFAFFALMTDVVTECYKEKA